MKNEAFDRTALQLSAALLLAGQLLYVVVTLFHTGGEANHHHAIFAAYAASGMWTAVHVAQFACMSVLLAGLFALCFALDGQAATARWAGRFGAALAVVTLALYGGVLAVDGVALKQAVDAWASAPEAEKAARFATAEAIRWLEWGMRSYENFTMGLAVLLFAVAAVRTAWMSEMHTIAIVLAEVLDLTWMIWLAVVAGRSQDSEANSSDRSGRVREPLWRT